MSPKRETIGNCKTTGGPLEKIRFRNERLEESTRVRESNDVQVWFAAAHESSAHFLSVASWQLELIGPARRTWDVEPRRGGTLAVSGLRRDIVPFQGTTDEICTK